MILGLVSQLILKKNASFDVKGGGAEQQSLKFSRDWHNWTFLHIQLGSRRVRQNDPWLPEIVYIYGFQSISLQHQLYLDTQISLNNEGGKHQLGFISKQQLTLFFFCFFLLLTAMFALTIVATIRVCYTNLSSGNSAKRISIQSFDFYFNTVFWHWWEILNYLSHEANVIFALYILLFLI